MKTCFRVSKASLVDVTIKSRVPSGINNSAVSFDRLWYTFMIQVFTSWRLVAESFPISSQHRVSISRAHSPAISVMAVLKVLLHSDCASCLLFCVPVDTYLALLTSKQALHVFPLNPSTCLVFLHEVQYRVLVSAVSSGC